FVPGKAEKLLNRLDDWMSNGPRGLHPFFQSAYRGGGFAVGAGYLRYVSGYNTIDFRGSYSFAGYKLAESACSEPRLFQHRVALSVNAGWREATQVGFDGTGMSTSSSDRRNFGFKQPFETATLTVWPTRKWIMLRAREDVARWSLQPGQGTSPSIETAY